MRGGVRGLGKKWGDYSLPPSPSLSAAPGIAQEAYFFQRGSRKLAYFKTLSVESNKEKVFQQRRKPLFQEHLIF